MVNTNGTLTAPTSEFISVHNRGYKYGDGLFETLKVVNGTIFFWEDHYFRLMASMRIMRMDIPMQFTMEFLEEEIIKTLEANNLLKSPARVRLNVDRGEGGTYLPDSAEVNYHIVAEAFDETFYTLKTDTPYLVELYKDFYMAPGLLSGLKSNNKALQVMGSIFAKENDYTNCLVLNTNKNVIEALNGNVFMVTGDVIKTPPLEDGCLNGVLRKQLVDLLRNDPNYEFQEVSISPFELQKADELFITNVIKGIQPISQYRKKTYAHAVATELLKKLNAKLRLA
ncbi:MAG: aminotransferase class IV [Winogradskyella sp.]|nr:aminotransferase class IV [Winogradskyella sp.]